MPGHTGNKTELDLPFIDTSGSDVTGHHIVKIPDMLGRMNNRLYRQCRMYRASFKMSPPTNSSALLQYRFFTLPDTWFVNGAIKYAYESYMASMSDELNAGIKMAKWHDFHIDEQDPDGTWGFCGVATFDGDSYGAIGIDESISDSQVTGSDGTARKFNLMGNESNSYNIFSEYAKKLNYRVSDDESVSSDQPYDNLLDLDDADVLAERGDRAPYDRDFSGWLHDGTDDQKLLVLRDQISYDGNAHQGNLTTKTFDAPLGIVFITKYSGGNATDISDSVPELICRVAPGNYKGVRSHSLTA